MEVCLGSAAVVLAPVLPDSFGEVLARVIRQFRLPHRDVGKLLAFDFTPCTCTTILRRPGPSVLNGPGLSIKFCGRPWPQERLTNSGGGWRVSLHEDWRSAHADMAYWHERRTH